MSPLGLGLGLRPGSYLGERGPWLRWIATDGRVIPTNEERAHAERRKAEGLEARLKAYEVRFGPIEG